MDMNIGERIRICRKSNGFTQKTVAETVGLTPKMISFYENNLRTPPMDIIAKLSKLFEVSSDYLLGLSDDMTSSLSHQYHPASISKDVPRKNYLSYWIEKSGVSRSELIQELAISEETLNDYCSGRLSPSQDFLEQLSDLCKVSSNRLPQSAPQSESTADKGRPYKFDPEISRRMKQTFISNDYTYKTLASALEISENEVFNFIEYGFVPHVDILVKFSKMFSVSADYLLNLSDIKTRTTLRSDEFTLAAQQLNSLNRFIAYGEILKLVKEQAREEAMKFDISADAGGKEAREADDAARNSTADDAISTSNDQKNEPTDLGGPESD